MSRITVPFFRIPLGKKEEKAVHRVIRSGWITTGNECLQFEKEFAQAVNTDFAMAVSSATAGLHLVLEAAMLPPGSGVALSPFTFAACAQAILQAGHYPVFVDIEQDGYHLDPRQLEACIATSEIPVRAVMPIHIAGDCCDMNAIGHIADTHRLHVVEDAAHMTPLPRENRYPRVFSFYATKSITTAEGGMISFSEKKLVTPLSSLRLHGMSQSLWHRYHRKELQSYDIVSRGFKYNLPDLLACIGRIQLHRATSLRQERIEGAQFYLQELANSSLLILPRNRKDHDWHLFIVRIRRVSRDLFRQKLAEHGIATSVHFPALHHSSFFSQFTPPLPLPHASQRSEEVVSLPLFPGIKKKELQAVVSAIRDVEKELL